MLPKPQTRAIARQAVELAVESSRLDTRLQDIAESTFESALTKQSTIGQEILSPLHPDSENTSQTNPSPHLTEPAYDSFR